MRRIGWMSTVAVMLLGIVLAGCGSGNQEQAANTKEDAPSPSSSQESAKPSSSAPAGQTKITYWTFDRHDAEYMKEKVADFNATNPDGIEVEITVMAENYNQSLDIAFSSGQSPDVYRARPSNVPTFYKKDYMEPLDDYMSDELKSKFASTLVDEVNQMDGKTFSLPNFAFTSRLIYNVELFEKAGIKEPPKSLDEMVAAAKKLREAGKETGAYGFAVNFKNPMNAYDKSIKIMAQLSGLGGYGYDFRTGKYDFTGHKPIVEAFRQMKEDGSMMPGVESLDIDPLRAQFAEGKVGMYMSLSAEVGVFKDQFPAKIKWDSAPIPTIDGTVKGAADMLNGGTWLVMSKESKHKEAAWKFMEYMYSDRQLTDYYETGQGITLVPHVLKTAKTPTTDNIAGFLPISTDALWPVAPSVKPDGMVFADAYVDYYLKGGNLDDVMADLNKRYNAALDKAKADGTVKAEPIVGFDPIKLQGTVAQ